MLWLHDYLITDINTWFELLNMWSCQHKKGSELNKCKDHQTSIQTVKNCGKKCIHTMLDGKNSKMIVGMCLYIHVCFSSTIKQQLLTSRRQKTTWFVCPYTHLVLSLLRAINTIKWITNAVMCVREKNEHPEVGSDPEMSVQHQQVRPLPICLVLVSKDLYRKRKAGVR
jgi:hypothetical protein